jgi:hypothetical protein
MPAEGMEIAQKIKVQLVWNPPHIKDAYHSLKRFSGLDITLYQPVPLLLNVFRGLCKPIAREIDKID